MERTFSPPSWRTVSRLSPRRLGLGRHRRRRRRRQYSVYSARKFAVCSIRPPSPGPTTADTTHGCRHFDACYLRLMTLCHGCVAVRGARGLTHTWETRRKSYRSFPIFFFRPINFHSYLYIYSTFFFCFLPHVHSFFFLLYSRVCNVIYYYYFIIVIHTLRRYRATTLVRPADMSYCVWRYLFPRTNGGRDGESV